MWSLPLVLLCCTDNRREIRVATSTTVFLLTHETWLRYSLTPIESILALLASGLRLPPLTAQAAEVINMNNFNLTDGAAVAIRRTTPGGKAASAALLTLILIMGISGCSHSKQPIANSQNSSTQNQSAQMAAPAVSTQVANQPELTRKKSVKGPVKRLPATRTYNDEVSGLSFTYPRKSMLEVGDKAEQDGIVAQQLPMNFVQSGGVTMAVVELPGIAKSGSDFTPAFFAISVNKDLSAEQCGQFAGEDSADKANSEPADTPVLSTGSSKLTIDNVEYVELDKQTKHGSAKYFHRFVPGATAEDNACYEFAMSVKSLEPKQDAEKDLENKAAFISLEKILASVNIKGDKKSEAVETVKAQATKKDNAEDAKSEVPTAGAKTAAQLDQNPR